MRSAHKLLATSLTVWFLAALFAGGLGWFRAASAPTVAITVWTLTALALLACWRMPTIRVWTSIVDLRWLVSLHLIRFVAGLYFILDYRAGIMSGDFALPAGIGDMIVACLAVVLLALFRTRAVRPALWIWNSLGLADILFVVVNALRVGSRDWIGMAPLRELPLSLLPTFVVPLVIASHLLIFVRLARRDRIATS